MRGAKADPRHSISIRTSRSCSTHRNPSEGRPAPQIAGDRNKRSVGEQIEAAFEPSVGDTLSHAGDQPISSAAIVSLPQDDMLRRDGTI